MRRCVALLLSLGAVTATGCGDDKHVAWDGPPQGRLPSGGTLPVDGFTTYLRAVDEPWERSLVGLTLRCDHR